MIEAQNLSVEHTDAATMALSMARTLFGHKAVLDRGEQPRDAVGNPIDVEYIQDIPKRIKECFGNDNAINDAILAGYEAVYSKDN